MVQLSNCKLIIWDLDDTFWTGTLSEGGANIPEDHASLIRGLTDAGIMNSICSKNDAKKVERALTRQGLNELFVFKSVNWEPKGHRVKEIIERMQLRPANVLFLDDNPSNREEALYYVPGLAADGPEVIPELAAQLAELPKKDPQHSRLQQYHVLEAKAEQKSRYATNEEFLLHSAIRVELGKDCEAHIERIHDLLLRSNQLNFTKVRSTEAELRVMLNDPAFDCGYVSVKDRFGDYGTVGFYALSEGRLAHFVFSCRTLGMGIEQYVYHQLGRPALETVGEVTSSLEGGCPCWINRSEEAEAAEAQHTLASAQKHTVLIKGPCDLYQLYPFISNSDIFDTEFTYTTDTGFTVESTGHTTHIVEALRLSEEQKRLVLSEVPFTDAGMYSDRLYTGHYKVIVVSILADANLGVYRRRDTGERLAIMEYIHPLTEEACWGGIISGEFPHAGFRFTREILERFRERYEFLGRNTPEQIVENLSYIRSHIPADCVLAVMLGGELYYEKNTFEAYRDRHLVHREINRAVREWAAGRTDTALLDVNRYLVDQSSFYDHFNHYIKPVYYALAGDLTEIINEATGSTLRERSRLRILREQMKEALAPAYRKLKKLLGR